MAANFPHENTIRTVEGEAQTHTPSRRYPDGLSLYRALARQTTGDPRNYKSVMNGVLDHFIRILWNEQHILHTRYADLDRTFESEATGTIFGALACPDFEARQPVLDLIAAAINARILIYGRNSNGEYRCEDSFGAPELHAVEVLRTFKTHRVLRGPGRKKSSLGRRVGSDETLQFSHFDSLLPDESGSRLIHVMKQKKAAAKGAIKEIRWWMQGRDLQCFNEYTQPWIRAPNLGITRANNALCIFTLSVDQPEGIQYALEVLDEAMRLAPAQELPLPVRDHGGTRYLKRYLAIDAEFIPLHADRSGPSLTPEEKRGLDEELCSVLTVAVDRHVVLNFHILAMLESPTPSTVPMLSKLFERLLFNDQYLKVWFNFQSDIAVIDGTIAHMFQGTPRQPFAKRRQWNDPSSTFMVHPAWMLRSRHFLGTRPAALTFSTNEEGFHCELHSRGYSNAQGLVCPCKYGHVDVSPLLDYICRDLNLVLVDHSAETEFRRNNGPSLITKRSWMEVRYRCNYNALLKWILEGYPLYPILNELKNVPKTHPGGKGQFFKDIKPGMERADDMMGYVVGDVVGIALIVRYLTTTDGRLSLAKRLLNYGYARPIDDKEFFFMTNFCDTQLPSSETPTISSIQNLTDVPLVNDFPKSWKFESIGREYLDSYGRFQCGQVFQTPVNPINSLFLSHHEREKRVEAARAGLKHIDRLPPNPIDTPETRLQKARDFAHMVLFDPTKFEIPEQMTLRGNSPPNMQCQPVFRAGKFSFEDLLEQRQLRGNSHAPPRGFLATAGTRFGLHWTFDRQAGATLRKAALIEHPPATAQVDVDPEHSLNQGTVPTTASSFVKDPRKHPLYDEDWFMCFVDKLNKNELELNGRFYNPEDYKSFGEDPTASRELWKERAFLAWELDRHKLDTEEEATAKDDLLGPVTSFDPNDPFDPEGREIGRMMLTGPRWSKFVTSPVRGSSKSKKRVRSEQVEPRMGFAKAVKVV
ncbi:MAG: hypothetical protein M1833_003926 [Piccolia ochrophora]|nr:MAG: hypothetical protein M1833_003926 [Piccolia ochrophora]